MVHMSQITLKIASKCMLSAGTRVKTHKFVQVYKQVVTNLLTIFHQVTFAKLPC